VNALGLARKYREIPGEVVGKAMLNAALDPAPEEQVKQTAETRAGR